MNVPTLMQIIRIGLSMVFGCVAYAVSYGQTIEPAKTAVRPSIFFDKQVTSEIRTEALPETERNLIAKMPANFYHFGAATASETADAETLTVRFQNSTKLTRIVSTPDFRLEPGGSCVEGNVYESKSSCTVLIRFTPQGAGHRLGKLTISDSTAVEPLSIGLNGYGYSPVVSFTPAQIATVPGTFPSGKGLLNNAYNIAVDGGDALYIADTGNGLVRYIDSSGTIQTIAGGGSKAVAGFVFGPALNFKLTNPLGVAVDGLGNVYVSDLGDQEILQVGTLDLNQAGNLFSLAGGGSGDVTNCTASPCNPTDVSLSSPDGVAVDPSGNVFFIDDLSALDKVFFVGAVTSGDLTSELRSPFNTATGLDPLIDSQGNIYLGAYSAGECYITGESAAYADFASPPAAKAWIVAGTRTCGFSGDGGQAKSAEIGTRVTQMAVDLAGNLYFSDSANNRVRRVDAATGIIHTIAGTGAIGNGGDGNPSTSATLRNPTGVAVDSQGQVYIVNTSASTGSSQVIRTVGTKGMLSFASQLKGSASGVQTVAVANTGNDSLAVNKMVITGTNGGDFSVDANSTSCNFTAGQQLISGKSCQIGVTFKPTAGGTRTANLVLLDNTVTNSNTVLLKGTGSLPPPTFAITAPAAGSTVISGTTVKFSVSVTSASGAAPTGKVTFSVDGTAFGSPVTVASGAAAINLTGLTVKTHSLSAAYSGDANYAPATSSDTLIV
jgi:sugar lactone lactonase YvrE